MKKIIPIFLLIFLCRPSFAVRSTFESEKKVAYKNLRFLKKIIEKHDILGSIKKETLELSSQMDFKVVQYTNETRKKRKFILLHLHTINIKISEKLQFVCEQLKTVNSKWLRGLTAKLQSMDIKPKKELYFIREKVSRQEYYRANQAYSKKQFLYSAHLHSRSLTLLQKIYQSFEWTLPKFQINKG